MHKHMPFSSAANTTEQVMVNEAALIDMAKVRTKNKKKSKPALRTLVGSGCWCWRPVKERAAPRKWQGKENAERAMGRSRGRGGTAGAVNY
ncbi:hypothetical protein BHE74_00039834 [Ensete ventricosum]|nr:hypothetical protein BHE74_00039834 [Ensete ventricosum]RZS04787.1 hypothetical protein BHM03_00035156 [Ensete ventricosum]